MQTVAMDVGPGQREIDIKNYAKVEKIPGGSIEDCKVLKGGPGVTSNPSSLWRWGGLRGKGLDGGTAPGVGGLEGKGGAVMMRSVQRWTRPGEAPSRGTAQCWQVGMRVWNGANTCQKHVT